MRYQVVQGVDCFEVGIQQLLDFMGWKSNARDDGWIPARGLGFCISYVKADDYVVVCTTCEFGQIGRPCVTSVFPNFSDAVHSANLLTMVEYDCMASRSHEFDMYFCYEVWHVVDDGDLWQAWEHDAELSRVDVPMMLDSRVFNQLQDASLVSYAETLYRMFVPCLGDFLSFVQSSLLRLDFPLSDCGLDLDEFEYVVLDDGLMPSDFRQLDDRFDDFEIVSAEDVRFLHDPLGRLRARRRHAADVMEALRQLRAAGDPCGGDGVGAIR